MLLTKEERLKEGDELPITRTTPEWCAAETGGIVLLLYLTSVRTPWFHEAASFIKAAAARNEDRRVPSLAVFRLDKRYPLDVGFDANFSELREGLRDLAPAISASAIVLEFEGIVAWTMRSAIKSITFPNSEGENPHRGKIA